MHKHHKVTVERCEKFTEDNLFADVNLYGALYDRERRFEVGRDHDSVLLSYSVPHTGFDGVQTSDDIYDRERMQCSEVRRLFETALADGAVVDAPVKECPGHVRRASVGDSFGPSWSTTWVYLHFEVPQEWADEEVHLIFDPNCEGLIFVDDEPMQGLTGGRNDRRVEWLLDSSTRTHTILVELAANEMFGCNDGKSFLSPPDEERWFSLATADVAVFCREAWDVMWDLVVITDMAKHLNEDSVERAQATYTCNRVMKSIDVRDRSSMKEAHALAQEFLQQQNGARALEVTAIGHCHIDTAWLWPYAETKRKCARSWSTALRLMDLYPDYQFVCSQVCQYEWMRDLYPSLFARMKERIAEDRFVITGGSWCEMDCNLPSGESFARQFLYGQRFYEAEFGKRSNIFFLPDTFGYSAQLPQIIREAGMEYFVTQKISWNLINTFPHNTFMWEGLDGSRVLTHFPPADTYTASATVEEIVRCSNKHKDKDRSNEALFLYGNGDGGGGPTMEMIERLGRMRDCQGLPKVAFRSVDDFFERVTSNSRELVTWSGELYLELHRGTYTSQANNKKWNRKGEFLLQELECWATLLQLHDAQAYPRDELDRLWKLLLLNQFHDVIPGSSIHQVFVDSDAHYADIMSSGTALRDAVLQGHAGAGGDDQSPPTRYRVYNSNGIGAHGQVVRAGDQFVYVPEVPSLGYVDVEVGSGDDAADETAAVAVEDAVRVTTGTGNNDNGDFVVENGLIVLRVQGDGRIVSLYDKECKRECIIQGKLGNQLVMYTDMPLFWDAWDVEIYHLESKFPVEPEAESVTATVVEEDALRVRLRFEFPLSSESSMRMDVVVNAHSKRVDVECRVDWHENRKILKVEFPLRVRSSHANYEIQYGHCERPTHVNTSWDMAKFEVCAHKWADLSEHGFGVALLNDSKYGYSCRGSLMALSLLRAPKAPDNECDMGVHEFTYALFPHRGRLQEGLVVQEGYKLNVPVSVQPLPASASGSVGEGVSMVHSDSDQVIISSVKRAEDDANRLILRLYECAGAHADEVTVHTGFDVAAVVRCNLLEEPRQEGNPSVGSSSSSSDAHAYAMGNVNSNDLENAAGTFVSAGKNNVEGESRQLEAIAVADTARAFTLSLSPFEIVTVALDLKD